MLAQELKYDTLAPKMEIGHEITDNGNMAWRLREQKRHVSPENTNSTGQLREWDMLLQRMDMRYQHT